MTPTRPSFFAKIARCICTNWSWAVAIVLGAAFPSLLQAADPNNFVNNVICGYQAWYNTDYPSSIYTPSNGWPGEIPWEHWSTDGQAPSSNGGPNNDNVGFEQFPDVSGYNPNGLQATGLQALGDGRLPSLFVSYHRSVTEYHFSLMARYGIDGVAAQRFVGTTDPTLPGYARSNKALRSIRTAAEDYSRIFCVEYDCSGTDTPGQLANISWVTAVENDWQNNIVNTLGLTSSPMYAKQNGMPVVAFYGLGYAAFRGTAAECTSLINWFHARGVYVYDVGPPDWRSGRGQSRSNFRPVYNLFDALGSWLVSYDSTGSLFQGDLQQRNSVGKAYMPVFWAGFSQYNYHNTVPNVKPHNGGIPFWNQAYKAASLHIPGAFIAMFDELNEGTGIVPFADSSLSIPTSRVEEWRGEV